MNNHKKKNDIIAKIKKIKNLKIMVSIIGSILPLFLLLFIVIVSAYAEQFPNFVGTILAGGQTVYGNSASDLPDDLTVNGVNTWSAKEKRIFKDYDQEKRDYDDNFIVYNAPDIKSDKNEKFDISTPISTIHYQGVVNLSVFDIDYSTTFEDDLEYNGEGNVINYHTRNFYEQAGQYTGSTFIIYPTKRMLLGYMISTVATYRAIEYDEWVCLDEDGDPIYDEDGKPKICDNSGSIISQWEYLGKVTASSEAGAADDYTVSEAIDNVELALSYGDAECKSPTDEWSGSNACFDVDTIYLELFGERFEGSIIAFLEEKYKGKVPTDDTIFVVGEKYISASVGKFINYDLYQSYLQHVYAPYIYINCDDCAFRNASTDAKNSKAKGIATNIMQFVEAFKYYNQEDSLAKLRASIYPSVSLGGYIGGVGSVDGGSGMIIPNNGLFEPLPERYFDQLINPLNTNSTTITSCAGYYDKIPNTTYYCKTHSGNDIVGGIGGHAEIVSVHDGVVSACTMDSWGPYLEITHTMDDGTKLISYYRHWVDVNDQVSCKTLPAGREVKQGDVLGYESNQSGIHQGIAVHLHFGLKNAEGTRYYNEKFLRSKGASSSEVNGTGDSAGNDICDTVRSVCNDYCKTHNCSL